VDRVLIVGGGIGGLTLAGALGRRGVEVDVVDNQAPGFDVAAFERRVWGELAKPY
jgi:2-polyprenyl-6-methoxyphenol hydroxylase-like FAD-dependent oxidoreductase